MDKERLEQHTMTPPHGDGNMSEGILSMDQFLEKHESEHASFKAAKSATALHKNPNTKPGLFEVGARSSQHTIALHVKCQSLGIQQPVFTYAGSSDKGWRGQVSFPELDFEKLQEIECNHVYSSKQAVKELLSELALAILESAAKEGRIKKTRSANNRVSKYTVALHQQYQRLGLPQPFYTYEGSTDMGFCAQVSFPGLAMEELQDIQDEARYPSKNAAKEATSKLAFEAVEKAEIEGKFQKTKSSVHMMPKQKAEPTFNYTGALLEFQRSIGGLQPIYRDYQSGSRFACLVEIDGYSKPFGSTDVLHSSKKAARQNAASCVVDYFKEQGLWPTDNGQGGIKKKAKVPSGKNEIISTSTQAMQEGENSVGKASTTPSSSGPASYAQRVARMAIVLAMGTPEWKFTPSAIDRDFNTVQCYFRGAGDHEGPIGEVRNIMGKKKAKEECARLTLAYLEDVYAQRLEYGQKMMGGIIGGEELLGGVLGKASDGEKEAMQAKIQFAREMGSGSEDDLGFEDAMEEIKA